MKTPVLILAALGLVCGKPLPTGSLKDDLKEFLALVPTDKVLEIALDYLANDKEVRQFGVYIQSEEFPKIHNFVQRLKEYKDCLKFINDQGVDVYAIINEIHDIYERQPFPPKNTTRTGDGIYGLIEDVIAVLPLEDLTEFFDNKLETGEFFRTLVTALHPAAFRNMVHTVRAWPEYPEMLQILREMAVDVERMSKFLWEISQRETHTIQDDVKQFMALVPTEKFLSITLDYLANDPEWHEAFVYIQSEEFPKIHKAVQYLKEYKDCFKFINDDGVDVYAFIYQVNYILGLPPLPTTNTTRQGVGIYGLLGDLTAALPLDDFKALFDKKIETRQYFKTLFTALKYPVFVNVVNSLNTVRAWPEYQKVLQIVRENGVNEDSATEILRTVYGPSLRGIQSLQDELKKYMALVPTDKVLEIALDYLANQQQVREFVVYIQSEEFPQNHKIVERLKEYKDCLKFINDQGVDVYAIINGIHDIFERQPFQPTNTTRTGDGIYELIDDVIAALPLEGLTAFFDKKMETRELFQTLVATIHNRVFMNMVDTVTAWPEYPEMLQILQEMVVDVEHMRKLLWEIYQRETHTIQDDVKEFMALVPTEKFLSITLDYIAKDPEWHEAYLYIQSEEFPKIHKAVQYLKEYKDCFKFINDDGADVYTFIYQVNYILGLPPLPTTNTTRQGVGIYGLMDDLTAALPLNDFKALFDNKMETRQYFKTLFTALKSPVLVNMVDTARARPEYQNLTEALRQRGVDVDRIFEHLRPLFGPQPL